MALFLYFATVTTACCNGTLLSYEYALDRSRIGQADAAHETETLVCGGMCINTRTYLLGLMGTGPGFGDTPLITAIKKDQVEAVDALLECGASLEMRNGQGVTPLAAAICGGHMAMAKHLLEEGADPNAPSVTDLEPGVL